MAREKAASRESGTPAPARALSLAYVWFRQPVFKTVGEQVESARVGMDGCERAALQGDLVVVAWSGGNKTFVPISNVRNFG